MPRRFWTSTSAQRAFIGLALLIGICSIASAHEAPAGCSTNNVVVTVSPDQTTIPDGGTVLYTVAVTNGGAGACRVTAANVTFTCPAADGTATGTTTALATAVNLEADGSSDATYMVSCLVDVNPGVTSATGRATVTGTLHSGTPNVAFSIPEDETVVVLGATATPTATSTPTDTPTNTPTNTPTDTPTNPPTNTPTDTPTNTPIPPTNTPTDTPTNTPIVPTNTATNTPTNTPIVPTNTATNTPTNTPVVPTNTATNTPTNTPVVPTNTATNTPTNTPPGAPSATPSSTPTAVPTFTPATTPTFGTGPEPTITAAVPSTQVPTLSFPMMALFALLLAGAGFFLMRRS